MKNLVIVESPTKAGTLSRFLGNNYLIESTLGHIRDLPEKKLGIDIKSKVKSEKLKVKQGKYEFIPKYQIIPDRKKRVAELKKIVADTSSIILATDPDREGEAIAYHVIHLVSSNPKSEIRNPKFKRIVFHEITKPAILEALQHPQTINMQLVDAQQARRVLDRLVGYKLSPLLWNKLGLRWLSAGRVQSVALRLIVEREREIEKFVPQEYWLIDAELEKQRTDNREQITGRDKKNSFIARLVKIDGKKAEINNKEQADNVVADLKKTPYIVSNVEIKEVKRYPSPPFTTSTMQQVAARRFGWSVKQTMRTAQKLYEEGFITYHRTDSTNLSQQAVLPVRGFIKKIYGDKYLPYKATIYKTKSKVAQEAHEAIRPTDVNFKFQISNFKLGKSAGFLYSLIWRRFVACQMNPALFELTRVDVEADRYTLRVTGEKLKFAGWMVAYDKTQNSLPVQSGKPKTMSRAESRDQKERELPELTDGEKLNLVKLLPQQKFTEPPPRYGEGSLVKTLEEKGIGRPSTYAPIITTLQVRKYVEKLEKNFHPTNLGKAVCDFLVKHFSDVFAVTFTAYMEDELDDIANGKRDWQEVISEFYGPFNNKLEHVFEKAERVKLDFGKTEEKCEKCGGNLSVKMSKYGKFLACTNYPKCTYTKNILEKINIPCPKCGKDLVIKRTKRGKQFYGCSNYPKCTFAAWKKKEIRP